MATIIGSTIMAMVGSGNINTSANFTVPSGQTWVVIYASNPGSEIDIQSGAYSAGTYSNPSSGKAAYIAFAPQNANNL